MYAVFSTRRFFLLLACAVCCLALAPTAEAQTRVCADGSPAHTATLQEALSAPGIIAGVIELCPEDAALGISGDVGAAKQYLLSIARDLRNSQAPPNQARINSLNSTFAVCAANFLKAYSQTHSAVTIVSAFRCGPRTPSTIQCDRSENARAGGAAGSNHQVGLALDLSPSDGNYQRLWEFAKKNPQFGVCFPHQSADPPHMVLGGIGGSEGAKCAAQGITQPCSGAPALSFQPVPDTINTSDIGTEGSAQQSPLSSVSNLIRGLLGQQQAQQSVPPPPLPTLPSQTMPGTTNTAPGGTSQTSQGNSDSPVPCTPNYFCKNGAYYYRGSSCVAVELQKCPNGCADENTCAVTPSSTDSSSNGDSLSTYLQDTSSSVADTIAENASSALDQILAALEAEDSNTAADVATATPIALNQDLGNIDAAFEDAQIPTTQEEEYATSSTSLAPSGTPGIAQTFTSSDLSQSPASPSAQNTFALATLEQMKQSLLRALDFLRPFGRYTSYWQASY